MKKTKNITTILLLGLIVILMGSIFFISFVLTSEDPSKTGTSSVAPKKTKASSMTYSRELALNTITSTPTPTPTDSLLALNVTVTPQLVVDDQSDTISITPSPTEDPLMTSGTPTPTEILLAKSIFPTTDTVASSEASISPTGVTSLPETGFINNVLIMFTVAGLLIFFAFLF